MLNSEASSLERLWT